MHLWNSLAALNHLKQGPIYKSEITKYDHEWNVIAQSVRPAFCYAGAEEVYLPYGAVYSSTDSK